MRLTTKGRFAVTAMIDLAMFAHHGPVRLGMISQRQNISLSYLEQLFGKLRRHGLVRSVRGPQGGYALAQLACHITVAAIILAVDEPLDATHCRGKKDCAKDNAGNARQCMTHELWVTLNNKMTDYLASVSLQDLVDQQPVHRLEPIHLSQAQTHPIPLIAQENAHASTSSHGLQVVSKSAEDLCTGIAMRNPTK